MPSFDYKVRFQKKLSDPLLIFGFIYAALIIWTYWPTLYSDFLLWDDELIIVKNPHVVNFNIKGMWTDHTRLSFFPLTLMNFALDYKLFGFDSRAFHAINIFWHIINTFVFMYLFKLLFKPTVFVLALAGAVFAFHPAHTEIVAWASARRDLLSTFFIFLTLIYFYKIDSFKKISIKNYLILMTLTFLAISSKPIALVIPALLFVLESYKYKAIKWQRVLRQVPVVLVVVPFVTMEMLSEKVNEHLQSSLYSPLKGIFNVFNNILFSLSKFIWPAENVIIYDFTFYSLRLADYILAAIMLILILYVFIRSKKSRPMLLLGIACFLITLLPVSKLIPFGNSDYNIRYLYLGSFGLITCVYCIMTYFFQIFYKLKYMAWIFLVILIGSMAYASHQQTKVWKNEVTLWTNVIRHFPKAGRAYNYIGYYFLKKNDFKKAIIYLEKAYEYAGGYVMIRNNLAFAYSEVGRYEDAVKYYKRNYLSEPNDPILLNNLAHNLSKLNKCKEAEKYYLESIQYGPRYIKPYLGLAYCYEKLGQNNKALRFYELALKLRPQDEVLKFRVQGLRDKN